MHRQVDWSGLIQAATLHLIASIPNAPLLEYCVRPNPLNTSLAKEPIKVVDGIAHVPEGPGLGVELDDEQIERFAVKV